MNLGRTLVIAANVFREVIRDRVLYLVAIFAALLLAAGTLLPGVAAGTENQMMLDLGLATISILGLAVAVFVGTGLINKEIEKRTVYVMIAKPISTAEFIVGKHWGLSAVLGILIFAMTGINLGILHLQQIAYPWESLLVTALFQWLELSLVAAIAILFGVFTNSLLAMLLTFATWLMGHFSRDLVTLGGLSKNPQIEQVTAALYLLLPDLARLDLKNQAVYGMALLPSPLELFSNAAYSLIYMALLLAIATFIFARRQF